jgi:RNA recognition motif-containing protein
VQRKEDTIASKVFVGNLNYETTETDLLDLFTGAGEVVEVFLPLDRNTGRPRGFAFVEFVEQESVGIAIEKFNEHDLRGRKIRINEAEERPSRAPRIFNSQGGGGGGGGQGGDRSRFQGGRPSNPKGSRRNIRGKKRSL